MDEWMIMYLKDIRIDIADIFLNNSFLEFLNTHSLANRFRNSESSAPCSIYRSHTYTRYSSSYNPDYFHCDIEKY